MCVFVPEVFTDILKAERLTKESAGVLWEMAREVALRSCKEASHKTQV